MKKFLTSLFFIISFYSLFSADNLTEQILKAYNRSILSGIDFQHDLQDPTVDGQELIKLKTKIHNLKHWLQNEHTDLENKTLIGLIGAAIKNVKDDTKNKKKYFLDKNTRCAYDKEIGSCNCVTVVAKEYFDTFKNAADK